MFFLKNKAASKTNNIDYIYKISSDPIIITKECSKCFFEIYNFYEGRLKNCLYNISLNDKYFSYNIAQNPSHPKWYYISIQFEYNNLDYYFSFYTTQEGIVFNNIKLETLNSTTQINNLNYLKYEFVDNHIILLLQDLLNILKSTTIHNKNNFYISNSQTVL